MFHVIRTLLVKLKGSYRTKRICGGLVDIVGRLCSLNDVDNVIDLLCVMYQKSLGIPLGLSTCSMIV